MGRCNSGGDIKMGGKSVSARAKAFEMRHKPRVQRPTQLNPDTEITITKQQHECECGFKAWFNFVRCPECLKKKELGKDE